MSIILEATERVLESSKVTRSELLEVAKLSVDLIKFKETCEMLEELTSLDIEEIKDMLHKVYNWGRVLVYKYEISFTKIVLEKEKVLPDDNRLLEELESNYQLCKERINKKTVELDQLMKEDNKAINEVNNWDDVEEFFLIHFHCYIRKINSCINKIQDGIDVILM